MRSSLSLLFEYVQRAFAASQRTFVSLYALEDNLMHVRALLHFDKKKKKMATRPCTISPCCIGHVMWCGEMYTQPLPAESWRYNYTVHCLGSSAFILSTSLSIQVLLEFLHACTYHQRKRVSTELIDASSYTSLHCIACTEK